MTVLTIGECGSQLTGTGVHSPSPAIFGPFARGVPGGGGNQGGTSGFAALLEEGIDDTATTGVGVGFARVETLDAAGDGPRLEPPFEHAKSARVSATKPRARGENTRLAISHRAMNHTRYSSRE